MKCDQIRDLMGAFISGDLSPDEMRQVRAHAQGCGACKQDLETRSSVVAAISDKAPTLLDAERQRIAWAVRGAVSRAPEPEPAKSVWLPAFGVALALLAGIALGTAIDLVVTGHWGPASQQATGPSKSSVAVVEVKEEHVRRPAKHKTEIAAARNNSSGKRRDPDAVGMTEAATNALEGAIRRGAGIAATTRGNDGQIKKRDVTPREKPVVVQPEKEKPVDATVPPATKVPLPKGPNNVRTGVTDEGQ